jgi:hypothetical protein
MSAEQEQRVGGLEYFERVLARATVIAGCSFWVIAGVALVATGKMSVGDAVFTTIWPFLGTLVALIVGWLNERLASILLFTAALALVAWGVIYAWEVGVWALMAYAVVGPTALSAILFLLAARASDRREALRDRVSDPS